MTVMTSEMAEWIWQQSDFFFAPDSLDPERRVGSGFFKSNYD